MTASICLNADLGEMPGVEGRALDSAMLGVVTRCNIACGGHAGDAEIMRETVRTAKINGVQMARILRTRIFRISGAAAFRSRRQSCGSP